MLNIAPNECTQIVIGYNSKFSLKRIISLTVNEHCAQKHMDETLNNMK